MEKGKLIISTIHDPTGSLGVLLSRFNGNLSKIQELTIAATPQTKIETISKLREKLSAKIVKGGLFGTSRINALKGAYTDNAISYIYIDFDKLLHWLEVNPTELYSLMKATFENDYTQLKRSKSALKTYPRSWLDNELPSNDFCSKLLNLDNFDIHSGQFVLSSKAAKTILNEAKEPGSKTFAEWLMIIHRHKLKIASLEVDGISWEDPDRLKIDYQGNFSKFSDWVSDKYNSPEEWLKRKQLALDTNEVISQLI